MSNPTRREKVAALAATAEYNPNEAANAASLLALLPSTLGDIASQIKAEWGRGIDSQFAIGHLLIAAAATFPPDQRNQAEGRGYAPGGPFTDWFRAQNFPFVVDTARRLREAAEREPEVRSFIKDWASTSTSSRDISPTTAITYMNQRPVIELPPRARNEAAEDLGFLSLRTGIHRLLGWQVDDEGVGGPTRNRLVQLPAGQLTELKVLVESLAQAFGEAVRARKAAA